MEHGRSQILLLLHKMKENQEMELIGRLDEEPDLLEKMLFKYDLTEEVPSKY